MNSKKIKNYFGKWISSVFFLMILNCFFSCKTVPTIPEKEINLKEIPKEEKVELNQYNIQAYKNHINTLSYAPQEKVVGYEHSWKVSKSGQYIGVGIDHDIDDQKTYVKITYSW